MPVTFTIRERFVLAAYFLSGFAALLYQVAWQRSLFSLYGSDLTSTTMVVSVFLGGLGVGSLLGGSITSAEKWKPLIVFASLELFIGLFGAGSLVLFAFVGVRTAALSLWATTAVVAAMLSIPTVAMGASLPVLVTHSYRAGHGVGQSVSDAYFFNTLGAACGAFAGAAALIPWGGLSAAVWCASLCNFGVVCLALWAFRRVR